MNHACHKGQLRQAHAITLSLFTQLKLSNTITQQAAISKPHHKSTDSSKQQIKPPYKSSGLIGLRSRDLQQSCSEAKGFEVLLRSCTKKITKRMKYRQTVRQSLSHSYHFNMTVSKYNPSENTAMCFTQWRKTDTDLEGQSIIEHAVNLQGWIAGKCAL